MPFHQFVNEDHEAYGSFEVFYNDGQGSTNRKGWYWWACFPGCLPDGEAQGPFYSEDEAIENAQENA